MPPGAVFYYSRDRACEHPQAPLAGYSGIFQADGYSGMASSTRPAASLDRSWKPVGSTPGARSS
jgi:transposase